MEAFRRAILRSLRWRAFTSISVPSRVAELINTNPPLPYDRLQRAVAPLVALNVRLS